MSWEKPELCLCLLYRAWNSCALANYRPWAFPWQMQHRRKEGLNFKAVSRSFGGKPLPPPNLPDIAVHVDLHTRKDPDPQTGWVNLVGELETGLASGSCGIMLHHMRMNDPAFLFLEYLLDLIAKTAKFSAVTYRELV